MDVYDTNAIDLRNGSKACLVTDITIFELLKSKNREDLKKTGLEILSFLQRTKSKIVSPELCGKHRDVVNGDGTVAKKLYCLKQLAKGAAREVVNCFVDALLIIFIILVYRKNGITSFEAIERNDQTVTLEAVSHAVAMLKLRLSKVLNIGVNRAFFSGKSNDPNRGGILFMDDLIDGYNEYAAEDKRLVPISKFNSTLKELQSITNVPIGYYRKCIDGVVDFERNNVHTKEMYEGLIGKYLAGVISSFEFNDIADMLNVWSAKSLKVKLVTKEKQLKALYPENVAFVE